MTPLISAPLAETDYYIFFVESSVATLKERPRCAKILVAGNSISTWRSQRETGGEKIFRRLWRRRYWKIAGALPPVPVLMVIGREDVEYDLGVEGGAVPDGLHSRDGSLSNGNVSARDPRHNSYHYIVLVCLYNAPLREHARYLGGAQVPPPPPTDITDEGGQKLRGPMEGRPKTAGV